MRASAFAFPLLPLISAGIALIAIGGGRADSELEAGLQLGVLMILVGGGYGALLGQAGARPLALEIAGMVLGAGAGWGLARLGGLPDETALPAALVLLAAWLLPWCWSLPLRAAEWCGVAKVVHLASLSLLLATPYLVPSSSSDLPPLLRGSSYSNLPEWVTAWNPIARLHGSVLGQDWFHYPMLYPRVGERYYAYAGGVSGLLPLALSAAATLALGLLLARRASRTVNPGS